ncbi:MAG: RNA polymerase sigma factor [Opitutaceae bacterium]|nr:RNA polymerase sigma factor [Opitutaceae bacterium]
MSQLFQEVIDSNYEKLYRYAWSLSGSSDEAGDLTQETFLIWAKKGSSIRSSKATKSWLYTTLYREFLRKRKRSERFVAIDDSNLEPASEAVEESYLQALDSEMVMDLLMTLKFKYRKVISLFYLESYTYKEISSILDIPIGTVMSRLARSKELLKKEVKQAEKKGNLVKFSDNEGSPTYG